LKLIYFKNVKKEKKYKKIRLQYWQEITCVGIMYNTLKSFEIKKVKKGYYYFYILQNILKVVYLFQTKEINKKY